VFDSDIFSNGNDEARRLNLAETAGGRSPDKWATGKRKLQIPLGISTWF
jgi:hypothetical protein